MGASAKTKQNSVSTYTPTPQASQFYTGVLDQAQAAQSAYNPATAKTIAGLTPAQLAAFGQVGANQGAWLPGVNQAQSTIADASQGITGADISKFFNPYQDEVIDRTVADINRNNAMDQRAYTANQVAQSGLGGNGYFIGQSKLAGDQAQARGDTIANMRNTGWQQALTAAQADKTRGISAASTQAGIAQLASQLGYQDAAQMIAAGNQPQQQPQHDALGQNALNEQLWPMQQAQWLAGIGSGIGPLTGGTTTGSGTATTSQGKGAGSIIGSGLSLMAMASDERVKENERIIGHTFDGQKIYKFNYKGDPRSQIGLMAQDVEQDHPEAVHTRGDGVKMVNYDQALSGSGMADGGVALPQGLMGWADIRPAQVRPPEAPDVRAPQLQQEEFDPQAAFDMGKKAGAGIDKLGALFGGGGSQMPSVGSPAAGSLAASGLQGFGGSGGGLASLMSLLPFADGGYVETPEEMDALEDVESGGRDVVNPKSGAFGPRQLMPATARDPGFGVRPLDPAGGVADQRRFSNEYFRAMLNRYDGDRDAARIAYNGGPRRADAWIKAGRDDSVIPQESADYYKKIANRLGEGPTALVAKAQGVGPSDGEPYTSRSDRAGGGFLKRIFGVDFNPLNLTEPERKAMLVAGLAMMSSGNVGKGGLAGMQYLSGIEAGERERSTEAAKLAYQQKKDADDLALRTRAQDLSEKKETREAGSAERSYKLDLDKFNQGTKTDTEKLAWEKQKRDLDAGNPSPDMKEYASYAQQETAAGRTPIGFFEYQKELKAAGRPQTNVSVSGDKKGAEEMAKGFAKMYEGLRTNAEGARTLADNLDQVERATGAGLRTGAGGEAEQYLRKIGAAIGIGNIEKVAAGELVQTISNKMALQVRAPGGESGGMPGAMSDADRQFLKDTVPGLLKTPEGNRQVIAIMRAAAARHEQIFDMAVDYAEAHDGQLGPGFDRQVRDFVKNNPLSAAVADAIKNAPPAADAAIKVPSWQDFTPKPGSAAGFAIEQVGP